MILWKIILITGKIVVTYNKNEYIASLLGFDENNDIAILKIDKQLEPMALGDSDEVKIGESITAIGNPNGDGSFQTAKGIALKKRANPIHLNWVFIL